MNPYIAKKEFNRGKKRVKKIFNNEKLQKFKDKMLDSGEEGIIKVYNLYQRTKEKFGKNKDKDESEEGEEQKQPLNLDGSANSQTGKFGESQKTKEAINNFETNTERINRIRREKELENAKKTYGKVKKKKLPWLEIYTDSKGRKRALSRKLFYDKDSRKDDWRKYN